MGRNSPLSPRPSNEEKGEEMDVPDLPVKALQQDEETEKSKHFEGNEEKVAVLGGKDVGTEGCQVKDRNLKLEEGGLVSGENADQGCGSASDQERKFKGEEGLDAGGTSKECSKEKENMEGGGECKESPSGVKKNGDRSDEQTEFLRKVSIPLAVLECDFHRISLEIKRLVEKIQEKRYLMEEFERLEVSEGGVKTEIIKKLKSETENSLDLLLKELKETALELDRLMNRAKDIDLVIPISRSELKEFKLLVLALLCAAVFITAAFLLKNLKRC